MKFRDKTVVITGGSSGIGLAVAHEMLKQGAKVFLIARDRNRLATAAEELNRQYAGAFIKTYQADVSDKEAVRNAMKAIGDGYSIDVLINSAGIIRCGRFEDIGLDSLEEVCRTNYLGALNSTMAALPYLKASRGHIAFISSVAGYMGLIGHTAYAPTKFAVTGLAEALRMELKDYAIRVSVIFPPDADTPMLEYERSHTLPESLSLSQRAKLVSAGLVAEKLVKGMEKGRFEIFCNAESRLLRAGKILFPRLYFRYLDHIVSTDRKKRLKTAK